MTALLTFAMWLHVTLTCSVVLARFSDRPLIGWPLTIALTFPLFAAWGFIARGLS